MVKKVYMIHGWGGSSKSDFFPWLKKELEKRNLKVESFDMPHTNTPRIESWVKYLEEKIKDADEDTYFLGHSIGCQTIMRFLEKMHKHKRVGGCIFVAGFFNLPNLETKEEKIIAEPWVTTKIDFSRILDHCSNFLCIFSDNDPDVSLGDSNIFKEKLGADIVVKRGREHFNEEKEPGVLEETLKFLKIK